MNRSRYLPRTVIAVAIAAAISVALPGFLVGGLSVQIRGEFGVAEGRYGWAMSTYFLAATTGSILLGRLAQIIGPRRQLTIALIGAAGVDICIALFAKEFSTLIAFLAVAGMSNAAAQTAVNLGLAQAGLPRLGLAIAVKQSGMPAASMLSGLAVPALALTLGWRWAFVGAAAVALTALSGVQRTIARSAGPAADTKHQPQSPLSALIIAGVAAMFLSFGAGALNAWVVESGVDSGLGKGTAGIMLSVGAALGIAIRVGWGMRLDHMRGHPFVTAGLMACGGALGVLGLALRLPATHVIATVVAFSGGWIWPVFLNFGVVRANEGRAASATGITQTGVYLGVFAAPLTAGAIIERSGYTSMWMVTAAAMAIGGVLMARVSRRF
ncbi:MAG: MFS transporter [Actinomycetota bacterium]|nr:MFS transporter [Actinomycetota bacterium]